MARRAQRWPDAPPAIPAKLGVVGLGLIGGSLAKAVRRARPDVWIVGVDPEPRSREAARRDFTCDEVAAGMDKRLRRCEVIVLAAPVPDIVRLLAAVGSCAGPGAAVTDVGGAKSVVVRAAEKAKLRSFVGSHPMMGNEKSGYDASRDDLLHGGVVAICPWRRSTPEAVQRVEGLWRALGNRTVRCEPEDHDRAVALVSHLPYLAASALCRVSAGRWDALTEALASTGFLSTTRIASDGTVGEAAIANESLRALADALAEEIGHLGRLCAEKRDEARGALAAARTFRRTLKS